MAAREWIQSGREPSYLATGSRLEQFEAWRKDGRIASTHVGLVSRRDYDTEVQQLLETKTAEVANRASNR